MYVGGTVMTFAAVTLLGMTMGQPLGPDYYPMKSRTIKLPIEYKKDRKTIRHVLLYVAQNRENTWTQVAFVTPDKDSFVYVAKDDGEYWFKMVIVDLKGNRDPADLTRDPPDIKMVIDTAPPQIRVTDAKRDGQDIVIKWSIEDKFPNDAETKIHFRPTDNPKMYWQEVGRHPTSPTGVGFKCGTNDAITVKLTAVDIVGNRMEITKDFPAAGASTSLSPGMVTPPAPTPPSPPVGMGTGVGTGMEAGAVIPPPTDFIPPGPVGPGPVPPGPTPPAPPIGVGVAPAPIVTPPTPPQPTPAPAPPIYATPAMPITPYTTAPRGGNTGVAPTGGPTPLATMDPKAATGRYRSIARDGHPGGSMEPREYAHSRSHPRAGRQLPAIRPRFRSGTTRSVRHQPGGPLGHSRRRKELAQVEPTRWQGQFGASRARRAGEQPTGRELRLPARAGERGRA